jgi:hypothetical protein
MMQAAKELSIFARRSARGTSRPLMLYTTVCADLAESRLCQGQEELYTYRFGTAKCDGRHLWPIAHLIESRRGFLFGRDVEKGLISGEQTSGTNASLTLG